MNAATDLAALKTPPAGHAWASGDYAVIGTTLQIVGESLAEAGDLRPDERVLDVAAGNGNATLAAARRGCRRHVDRLRRRAARAWRRARARRGPARSTFEVADAEALPFADAQLRRRPVDLRRDVRARPRASRRPRCCACCRPGGRIGLANWTPEGFIGQLFKTLGRHVAAAGRACSRRRCGAPRRTCASCSATRRAASIATRRIFNFRYRSAAHFIEVFRDLVRPGAQGLRRAAGRAGRRRWSAT